MASIRVVSAECNEIVEIMVFEMRNNDTAVQKLAFQRVVDPRPFLSNIHWVK